MDHAKAAVDLHARQSGGRHEHGAAGDRALTARASRQACTQAALPLADKQRATPTACPVIDCRFHVGMFQWTGVVSVLPCSSIGQERRSRSAVGLGRTADPGEPAGAAARQPAGRPARSVQHRLPPHSFGRQLLLGPGEKPMTSQARAVESRWLLRSTSCGGHHRVGAAAARSRARRWPSVAWDNSPMRVSTSRPLASKNSVVGKARWPSAAPVRLCGSTST